MSYTFNIPFDSDPKVLITKIKKEVAENEGIFDGDHEHGAISIGKIKVGYKIREKNILVTITDKPRLMPYKIIENKIRGYFK